MKKITYKGHEYKSDGKSVWRDGKLLDIMIPQTIKSIDEIRALRVDGHIWDGKDWYKKV